MFSPSHSSISSKVASPPPHYSDISYPLTPEDIQFDFQLSDDEIEKSDHDTDPPPGMSEHDMVYFAIHRPLRISASNPQYIQNLELDTVCYAIDDSTEGDASTSIASTSNKSTMQFTGAELPDMMNRYPNAIFYILQHPTWAEPEQLQDLFNQYPDSVVYYVPRPSYLPRVEPSAQSDDVKHYD
ncbi:hypothetical protein K450DRAFT_227704 [Umbelopsis ramanniana AG]|uniref:Uncharacterized protein n=1 Tax=Umbelopsis ramanniana AG TaxID=1314678 RepID=A0AAD5EFS9_UMBRA|nr:uncharacterized protein K450DRAFT_227704 [Umbelopsis ramanniana AG]KAI8582552.1 hypothetical protein K450DRAFT_227704 [Umbelopsis ramanniana AG]